MGKEEGKLPDAVNSLYEMELAIKEAKKINYLPDGVNKLWSRRKLYKEVLEKLSIGIRAIDLKLLWDTYEIVWEK